MRYERFRLEVRPAELTAFDRPAVLSRARDLLQKHPGIELVDITKATSGVDISVGFATGDPADEIVSDVLRRALELSGATGQFRRIGERSQRHRIRERPLRHRQAGPSGPEGPPLRPPRTARPRVPTSGRHDRPLSKPLKGHPASTPTPRFPPWLSRDKRVPSWPSRNQ